MRLLNARRRHPAPGATTTKSRSTMIAFAAAAACGLLVGCQPSYDSSPSTDDESAQSSQSDEIQDAASSGFDRPAKRMPNHGKVFWLDSTSNTAIMRNNIRDGGAGRLKVTVRRGSATYYVKLKELSPRRGEVLGVIVGPGRTLTFDVPLDGDGSTVYELNYGSGTSWYGRADSFGPSGAYATADDTFKFEQGTGWEVELISQVGGNLGTSGLDYQGF